MTKKYIGLTIGPIIKTISNAKETGQLWGGSYIFSYIMKMFIKVIKRRRLDKNFVIPYVGDEILNIPLKAGFFPDRLIFEPCDDKDVFVELEEIWLGIIKCISKEIANTLGENQEKAEEYINNYFQVYYVEKEISKEQNIIFTLSNYLDILELQEKIIPKEDENYLIKFLRNEHIKKSFLTFDAYGKKDNIISTDAYGKEGEFISTSEIAVKDLNLSKDTLKKCLEADKKDDEDFYTPLKNINNYHKYLAIVQADGDNISKVIESIKDYNNFSEKLFKYSKEAVKLIKNYGGIPVYAGGDDLLFFAPVVNDSKNIINLIETISKAFDKNFAQKVEVDNYNTTLSFGVTIVYHKYPLYEALESSRELLFNNAKKFKIKNSEKVELKKNAICFRVIKHSGQVFGTEMNKSSNSYNLFLKLLEKIISKEGNFLSSLQYRLKQDEEIIKEAIKVEELKDLKGYFANNFKKEMVEHEEFFDEVRKLIIRTYEEIGEENFVNTVYSCLRFIKFILDKEVENG